MPAPNAPDDRPIWVADSETDPFEYGVVPHPFIWGFYHGYGEGFYREFLGSGPAFRCTKSDIDVMVDWLAEQEIILYAHNGGKFDWHFLSHRFEPGSDLLIIHGRLSKFKIGKCEFRDSYNLLPVALEQYQKQKFDYTKMLPEHRGTYLQEIQSYLKSDCVNAWRMIHGFIESYGLHITQASAAMYYWQTKLKNKVPRSGPSYYDRLKPYYYGGRVQCFEQGDFKLPAQSVDINSAYPQAMLSPHPYGLQTVEREGMPRENLDKWGPMFFSVECLSKGALPYRGTNGSLFFPDDGKRRIYDVTGWELLAGLDTETIKDIKFLYHVRHEEMRDFSQYILHFWNLRKEYREIGDEGAVFYCKIFMNALYGKFASDPRKHRQYTLRAGEDLADVLADLGPDDNYSDFREWLIVSEDRSHLVNKQFYNIATAASITGNVRAHLWRAVCACHRPLYCDTDSVTGELQNGTISDTLEYGDELGQWSIEHNYDRVVIAGKKLYAMHMTKPDKKGKRWKIASKGARLTAQEIVRIASGETVTFKNPAATFSASKSEPRFISRDIRMTAADIRIVPPELDPLYVSTES